MYGTALKNTFEFVRAHMFDGQVITNRIDLSTCTIQAGDKSVGCGFVIESLSIYLNKATDQSPSDLWVFRFLDKHYEWTIGSLRTLIPTAIKYPGYTSSNGVNSEGASLCTFCMKDPHNFFRPDEQAELFGDYNAGTANKGTFIIEPIKQGIWSS